MSLVARSALFAIEANDVYNNKDTTRRDLRERSREVFDREMRFYSDSRRRDRNSHLCDNLMLRPLDFFRSVIKADPKISSPAELSRGLPFSCPFSSSATRKNNDLFFYPTDSTLISYRSNRCGARRSVLADEDQRYGEQLEDRHDRLTHLRDK